MEKKTSVQNQDSSTCIWGPIEIELKVVDMFQKQEDTSIHM